MQDINNIWINQDMGTKCRPVRSCRHSLSITAQTTFKLIKDRIVFIQITQLEMYSENYNQHDVTLLTGFRFSFP